MNNAASNAADTEEIAGLSFQIADLDQAAWNAEDREQMSRASAIRARIRPLQARLSALVAARAGTTSA